ncbi:MAG: type I restriction endonuclease subunit R, partial [Magnetococcales bacterium]|nr:type I restriction endonuclease subunit R [Magnetococcales bacterium]
MPSLSEAQVEEILLGKLTEMGYACISEPKIGPDSRQRERNSYGDVILRGRLEEAVSRINTDLPAEAQENAIRKVIQTESPSFVEENRRLHRLVTTGVEIEYYAEDGTLRPGIVHLIDYDDLDNNDWLAVNQFTVIEGSHNRRPDVVVFVNGLPLAVIELKKPGDEQATLESAYNQLQTYKNEIPSLFHTNAVLIISDGLFARIGSLTANKERFMRWRTLD